MTRVNLKIISNDGLTAVSYDFWLKETDLFLDKMYVLRKQTKRHGWKIEHKQSYSRIDDRDMGVKEEPDIPFEIQVEAVKQARSQIQFKRWNDK